MYETEKLIRDVRQMGNVLALTPDRNDIIVSMDIGDEFLGLLRHRRAEVTSFLVQERNEVEPPPLRKKQTRNWASMELRSAD